MKNIYHRSLFISILLMLSSTGRAQISMLEADRPDQTETPAIVPVRHWQFETGFIIEKNEQNSIKEETHTHPSVLAKYGVSDRFELRLIIDNSRTVTTESFVKSVKQGISPLQVGFKVRIAEEKGWIPLTSLIMHVAIPGAASKDLRADHLAPNFRFTMQHTISKQISLGYNLGAEWDGDTPAATGIYTITGGYKISERWGCYAELYGFMPERSKAQHSFDAGITFYLSKNIMLDISAGFALNKYAPDHFIGTGFSVRLPK